MKQVRSTDRLIEEFLELVCVTAFCKAPLTADPETDRSGLAVRTRPAAQLHPTPAIIGGCPEAAGDRS